MTDLALSYGNVAGRPMSFSLPSFERKRPIVASIKTKVADAQIMDVHVFMAKKLLKEYATLTDDWDCEGGHPIHPDTIRACDSIVNALCRSISRAEISPNSNGTISFEWSSDTGRAHLEVGKEKYSFYLKPKIGETVYAMGSTLDWSDFYFGNEFDARLTEQLFPEPTAHQISNIALTATGVNITSNRGALYGREFPDYYGANRNYGTNGNVATCFGN
jgi:hypothetical protein